MEVDRAVVPGRVAVALLAAVPVPAGHAAHRLVHAGRPRGRCRRRRRRDRSTASRGRCRPRSPSARAGRVRAGRRRPRARRARLRRAHARTAWAVDLAVVVALDRRARIAGAGRGRAGRDRERRPRIARSRRHRRGHASPLGDRHHRREQAVVGVAHRLLVDRRLAARGVVGAGHGVPAARPRAARRRSPRHRRCAASAARPRCQRVARAALGRAPAEDLLAVLARRRRDRRTRAASNGPVGASAPSSSSTITCEPDATGWCRPS